mgnify:CR=1 FL=1
MAEFTKEMMDDGRRARQLRRQQTVGKIRQAVGGAAETFRTGASAVDTFAKRAPSKSYMTSREKMERRAELLKMLGPEERAAYDAHITNQKNIMADKTAQKGDALSAESSRYGDLLASNDRRAAREMEDAQKQEDRAAARLEALGAMDETTKAMYDSIMSSYPEVSHSKISAFRREQQVAVNNGAPDPDGWAEASDDDIKDFLENERAEGMNSKALADALPADGTTLKPGQFSILAQAVAAAKGEPVERILSHRSNLQEVYTQDIALQRDQAENEERNISREAARAEEAAGSGGGRVKALDTGQEARPSEPTATSSGQKVNFSASAAGAPAAAAGADAAAKTAQAATAVGNLITTPAAAAPAAAAPAAAAPAAAAPATPGAHNLYGLQAPPVTDTMAKILQQLDYIEKYPEHPPLQLLRDKIMESTEFKEYAKNNELTGDLNLAYKEMHRDMRKKDKAGRAQAASKQAQKRTSERRGAPPLSTPTLALDTDKDVNDNIQFANLAATKKASAEDPKAIVSPVAVPE